jgi:sec-independent protein translocase protein TatB
MFDIGFWELALIAILALVLLGPKRLPEAARAAGYWVGRFRRFIATAKNELDQHMQEGDLEELRRLKQELDDTRRYIHEVAGQTRDDFTRTMEEVEDLEHQIGGSLSDSSGKGTKKKTGKKKKAARSAKQKRISSPAKKKASQKNIGKKTGKKSSKKTAKKTAKKKAGKKSPAKSRR